MKEGTRKKLGGFLIFLIILLIVGIFCIWYVKFEMGRTHTGETVNTTTTVNESEVAKTPTVRKEVKKLTEKELAELTEALNTEKNRPFLKMMYESVDEIQLVDLLYNGAGIGTTKLSDNEKLALNAEVKKVQLAGSAKEYTETELQEMMKGNAIKLARADIQKFWQDKTGKNLQISKGEKVIGIYVEADDSYYIPNKQVAQKQIICTAGVFDPNTSIYTITYQIEGEKHIYQVGLKQDVREIVFLMNWMSEEQAENLQEQGNMLNAIDTLENEIAANAVAKNQTVENTNIVTNTSQQ